MQEPVLVPAEPSGEAVVEVWGLLPAVVLEVEMKGEAQEHLVREPCSRFVVLMDRDWRA